MLPDSSTNLIIAIFRPAVFNVGEIAPQWAILCFVGRFCDLRDLGGDFTFQGSDFCRLKHTQMLNCLGVKHCGSHEDYSIGQPIFSPKNLKF